MRLILKKLSLLGFFLVFSHHLTAHTTLAQGDEKPSLEEIATEMGKTEVSDEDADTDEDDAYAIIGEEDSEEVEETEGEKKKEGCIAYAVVDSAEDVLKFHVYNECKKPVKVAFEVQSKDSEDCVHTMEVNLLTDEDDYVQFPCDDTIEYEEDISHEDYKPEEAKKSEGE